MLPQAASEFYALQQRVATTTANEARRIWRSQMGDDFDSSWRRTAPSILAVLAEGQSQMALRASGYTSAEVGARLLISSMTVNTHLRNIYRKLQVRTRAQAVRFASLRGLF